MYTLVIIRHGQSQWNKKNLFCGWTDVDLTEKGFEDALAAGRLLKKEGYTFDICYTSVLKRAIHTAYAVLDEMDLNWIPVIKDYHLNERHYVHCRERTRRKWLISMEKNRCCSGVVLMMSVLRSSRMEMKDFRKISRYIRKS